MREPVSGFVPGERLEIHGAEDGPLIGMRFAAKDIYDIEGHVTGGGNPDWAAVQSPATKTALAVQKLLDAGATLVGKTITDELTRGILGINVHDGTPLNPKAPDRLTGGSSSGSASVVAAGDAELALGSDTGGSVRLPASFCGIFGVRPTLGRVSLANVIEQSSSYDTAGWFTSNPTLFADLGPILLEGEKRDETFRKVVIAEDAFALADDDIKAAISGHVDAIKSHLETSEAIRICPTSLSEWSEAMARRQHFEAHRSFGDWVDEVNPRFSFDTANRFVEAAQMSETEMEAMAPVREAHKARVTEILRDGTVIALPTAPCVAPKRNLRQSLMLDTRKRITALTCIAGGAGMPQVTVPTETADGLPAGFSLIGPAGSDEALLELAETIANAMS